MNQQLTVQEQQQIQVKNFSKELGQHTNALKSMLPSHISVEKFQRAAVTAVNHNPDLLNADKQSVFNALTRCAGDGLLPDGRDAALVIFSTKQGNGWIKKAQYMPMVAGVIKRLRNTGEISTVEAHIVYKNDTFEFELGDNPHLAHKPNLAGDRGKPVLAYCIVNFKDGMKYREIMTHADIEKARKASKNSDKGPWVDWWDEMAKKTVIHRAAKRLPASADLDKLLNYDMKVTLNPEIDEPHENTPRPNKIIENAAQDEPVETFTEEKTDEEFDAFPGCGVCGGSGSITESDDENTWDAPCPECSKNDTEG